tara:strand:- start:1744 stop:2268 length:525 start_codon:yes stop_codon:yes gene_type:complete
MTTVRNVAFIGDGGVGKTTYINRLVNGAFEERYNSTIGYNHRYIAGEGELGEDASLPTRCSFNIFDFAGQERYGLLDQFSKEGIDIDVYFVFFQTTSKLSFKNCDNWISEIRKFQPNATILLIESKIDEPTRKVSRSDIEEYLDKRSIIKCIRISAKTSYNRNKPFLYIDLNEE